MKLFKTKYPWVITAFVLAVFYDISCTKDDKMLDTLQTNASTDLLSIKVSSAPTIDGTIDPIWENATKLKITTTVPDPGNNLFSGYIGESYAATIRSMYDDQYIYFLVEYADKNKSVKSAPWYFDPTTQRWAQEATANVYNSNGVLTREGFGEDKFAMLWNVDNSTPKFTTQTCYASCHVFTPYTDFSVTPPVTKANASSGNHYTNGVNEKIDMWWGHPNRGLAFNYMDDNYQDWAGGPAVTSLVGGSGNGRHFDDLVVSGASTTWPFAPTYTADATQGSTTNRQSLKLDGTGAAVNVPLWVIPNATNYDNIMATDIVAGGKAVKITGVSSTGVLTYSGGTIDPNVGTDYQRIGDAVSGSLGSKSIPSVVLAPILKGRADIPCVAIYTGSGWVWEFKRLLKTADVLKQDVNFSSLQDQPFGVAIWDKSNYQHAIRPNLVLKFKK